MLHEDQYRPELVRHAAERLIVISGCSGGGKSSLLAELSRRGAATVEEAGRQVVKEQLYVGGDALPWGDLGKFVELTISRSIHNMIMAARSGRVTFFDRGIVDQTVGLDRLGLQRVDHLEYAARRFRYRRTVFFTPPWPEIFRNDAERRHTFEEAAAGYAPLCDAYRRLGYHVVELPMTGVDARADFIADQLGLK